jgi:hypothetical protein
LTLSSTVNRFPRSATMSMQISLPFLENPPTPHNVEIWEQLDNTQRAAALDKLAQLKGSAGRSSLKPVPTGFSFRQGTTLPFGQPAPSCVRHGIETPLRSASRHGYHNDSTPLRCTLQIP